MTEKTRQVVADDWFAGEKIGLRLVRMQDCTDRYVTWLNDPEISGHLEAKWHAPYTLEQVEAYVRAELESTRNYLFAIIDRESEKHIGNIKIGPIDPNHNYAVLGYFIGERAVWGRGYGTDAIRVATRIAFDVLALHYMTAYVADDNAASGRVLEKSGYTLAARFKKKVRAADGTWVDRLGYGLLVDDWLASQQPG